MLFLPFCLSTAVLGPCWALSGHSLRTGRKFCPYPKSFLSMFAKSTSDKFERLRSCLVFNHFVFVRERVASFSSLFIFLACVCVHACFSLAGRLLSEVVARALDQTVAALHRPSGTDQTRQDSNDSNRRVWVLARGQ